MIAAQWDRARNGTLTPEQVTPYSNRRVWWRCAQGHEWRAPVGGRTKAGSDCPYCTNRKVLAGFNDLATLEPDIAAQWHPTLNGAMTPDMVTLGSHQRVWWQCAEGHVWNAKMRLSGLRRTHQRKAAGAVREVVCIGRNPFAEAVPLARNGQSFISAYT